MSPLARSACYVLSLALSVFSADAEQLIRRDTAYHHAEGGRHQHAGLRHDRRQQLHQDTERSQISNAIVELVKDLKSEEPAAVVEVAEELEAVMEGNHRKLQAEAQHVDGVLVDVLEDITKYAAKIEADGEASEAEAPTLRAAAQRRQFRMGTMIHVPLDIPPGEWYLKQFPSSSMKKARPLEKLLCSRELSDDCRAQSESFIEDGSGSAIVDFWSLLPRPDAAFRRMAKREYNMLVAGNACKMGWIQPARSIYNFSYCDEIRNFATKQMRGDFSFLSIFGGDGLFTPEWLFSLSPEEKHIALKDTVSNVMNYYHDVRHWTVVSEAVSDDDDSPDPLKASVWYPDVPNHIEAALTEANAVAPAATLIYSDYGGESLNLSHPGEPSKAKRILELVRGLVVRGSPIDGVGMQMHVGLWADDESWYEGLRKNIQYYADMLIAVHIDQMDVSTDTGIDSESVMQGSEQNGDMSEHIAERQAHVYARVLEICLSFDNCKSLTTWGFTDTQNPDPLFGSLPFDKKLHAKPAYVKMLDKLLFEKRAPPLATCTDVPSQAMIDMGMRCEDAVKGFENKCYGENSEKELWLREKLCRQSCFVAGSPYHGDDCSSS